MTWLIVHAYGGVVVMFMDHKSTQRHALVLVAASKYAEKR